MKPGPAQPSLAASSRHNCQLILSGKKGIKLKEKSKVNRKQKKASGAAGAAQLEMNGESASAEVSGEDERDEVSSSNSSVAPGKSQETHVWQTGVVRGSALTGGS